jgi:NADP-dependent 3-hydroxy acid dehydrogenase YdfG
MSKYLADKVVIITGAGGGFGKLIAQKSAAGGAKVVGTDINGDSLSALSDSLRVEAAGKIKVTTIKPTGVFGTNLASTVVNETAIMGLVGQKGGQFAENLSNLLSGGLRPEQMDVDSVQYWLITPDDLTDAVVHVIDQPWGISLSDVTVRATGENYVH